MTQRISGSCLDVREIQSGISRMRKQMWRQVGVAPYLLSLLFKGDYEDNEI